MKGKDTEKDKDRIREGRTCGRRKDKHGGCKKEIKQGERGSREEKMENKEKGQKNKLPK